MTDVSQAFAELKRGAEEILLEDELLEKLKQGKPLKLKQALILQLRIYILAIRY